MLDLSEARAVAEQFGVSAGQVARDHLISHLLAAISTHAAEAVIFFGGTALARTLLPGNRLSEDIDLIARDSRRDVATLLDDALPRALRREFPGSTWDPALTDVADPAPAMFRTPDGLAVRVQLLSPIGYPPWPTAFTELAQRYTDSPPATLWVPTAPAFAASKTTAWHDRAASRDLYDLWALAEHGHITADAAQLFAQHGPTNRPPTPSLFRNPPPEDRWQPDLGGQLRLTITAANALAIVREAWAAVSS
jgi:hypothetical protein